ncbi:hypothetical protein RhiJN_01575 [Ceratobasidium sp. AG-Ba]|nr:hypothetical protein RhiJN_01575 [Ceratobasidium sp. AG-Ba]
MDGVELEAEFEVFDSGGAFEILLGKPWLTLAKAEQRFGDDSLWLDGLTQPLPNAYPLREQPVDEMLGHKTKVEAEHWGDETVKGSEEVGSDEREAGVEEVAEEEDRNWRIAPRRSDRLRRRYETESAGQEWQNMFYVADEKIELLEEMRGMSNTRVEEVGQTSPEAMMSEALARAVRTKERREKAERDITESARQAEILFMEADHSAHLPETPSPSANMVPGF